MEIEREKNSVENVKSALKKRMLLSFWAEYTYLTNLELIS